MTTLFPTRRPRGRRATNCPVAAPRKNRNHNIPSRFVKGGSLSLSRAGRRSATRLPDGFIQAIAEAFMRPSRICDRVCRIRFVLETFNQSENVLPTKVRRFLERFEAAGGVQ